MIICEYKFDLPDRDNPNYSQAEVDYYSHIPYGHDIQQHRLSLRKSLKTGNYQVYRAYHQPIAVVRRGLVVLQGQSAGQISVIFCGSLQDAIDIATRETNKFWAKVFDEERQNDQVCQHKSPIIGTWCKGERQQ